VKDEIEQNNGGTSGHMKKKESFGVILPCAPADFGEFISGLLGKPQTIEKVFGGAYEIGKNDIANVFHLVEQRIHQQNDATLVQFTVKILYEDDSSVLLNNLEDFERYSEVRPLISVGVSLSWSYLIKFKNKNIPEKQEINLSFRSNVAGNHSVIIEDGLFMARSGRYGGFSGVFLRIHHTERTWGVDIESLVSGYVKSLIKNPNKTEEFFSRNSSGIGFSAGSLLFISSIIGVFITTSNFMQSYLLKMTEVSIIKKAGTEAIMAKIDFLLEVISSGAWPRFILSVVSFLVMSLILSIVLGTWVGTSAENRPKSFILLTPEAEKRKVELMGKRKRDWTMFGLSILSSIATGIVGNIIFTKYFGVI